MKYENLAPNDYSFCAINVKTLECLSTENNWRDKNGKMITEGAMIG